jgi:DNA gyrase subunit A
VHRRILYAMHEQACRPEPAYKKSRARRRRRDGQVPPARRPAIYDALVRMAQDFSLRYPLIDGQGNFGSVDGDSAAAMRYTEAA